MSMSMNKKPSQDVMLSLGQGKDTSTVLTNRSDFLTVIADESYQTRKIPTTLPQRHTKGDRPMHKTTLTFDVNGENAATVSCMKQSYSGRKDLSPSFRPPKCPSLHTSNFDIGLNAERLRDTNHKMEFKKQDVKHPTQTHKDNKRWKDQMSGKEMERTTRHCNSKQMDLDSTYKCIHDKLGAERGPGQYHPPQQKQHYNIINGFPVNPPSSDHRLISGNRLLHHNRNTSTTSILS